VKRTLGICPDAKILCALQMLANGTSPLAHQNYYQMGETTARDAMKRLCRVIYRAGWSAQSCVFEMAGVVAQRY
jgi:hypothetical protein